MKQARRQGRSRAIARWIPLLGATLLTWLPILVLGRMVSSEGPGALERAEFVADEGEAPPPDDAEWQPVALPDDWRDRRPGVRQGWYRVSFDTVASDDNRRAVYLPVVMMNAAVYVNGDLLGSGGRFEDPVARNWNRPLLFGFSSHILGPGKNRLHVRVKSDLADAGYLGRVHVGRFEELAPIHGRVAFIRQTVVWALIVVRLVAALFTATVWATWRREAYYGWFALCAVAWVVAELNVLVVETPLSTAVWLWILNVAIGWWGIFAVRLVMDFVGASDPVVENGLLGYGVAGSIVLAILAASGTPYFHPLATNVWLTLSFLAACTSFRSVVPRLLDYPDQIELRVVFVVVLSVVGCVLWDLTMQLGLRPRGGLTVPPYSSAVAVAGMGWVVLRRFVGALRQSQTLVATLEERVREQTGELEGSYARIREVERARVLTEERSRILRDLHDGLGTHLVSTLALVESSDPSPEALGRVVRSALDDLRLMIDSLEPLEGELLPAIGMLRARLAPRLEAAGAHIDWRVQDLPLIPDLGPHKVLQVLRILQQLFLESLGRRGARSMIVRTGEERGVDGASEVFVEITHDGGEAVPDASPKKGIDEAGLRAREIGGRLVTHAAPSGTGTIIRLWIPVGRGCGAETADRLARRG